MLIGILGRQCSVDGFDLVSVALWTVGKVSSMTSAQRHRERGNEKRDSRENVQEQTVRLYCTC